MIKHPKFATHYYLTEIGPFRRLSELPAGSEDPVFLDLLTRHQRESGYRRRYGSNYIEVRREVEARLRELFVARGGKPPRRHPFYLVLGESPWFRDLNANQSGLKILLSELDLETTSLTYPDSFIALSRDDKPYFNHVFLLSEINELVTRFGIPENDYVVPYERYWETDFELYIEVQLWDIPPGFKA
ncbi:hypothetical protein [Vreelandella sp. V005]|uniref:hypothetical protein n=1 Tax=Vreelandella sp. V005 TaxID=3459608 RepID=UPI0040444864